MALSAVQLRVQRQLGPATVYGCQIGLHIKSYESYAPAERQTDMAAFTALGWALHAPLPYMPKHGWVPHRCASTHISVFLLAQTSWLC